jgi:hypothetical protein
VVKSVSAEEPNRGQAAEIATRSSADLDNALTTLRDRVDQEFKRTERLDSKSRQAFAIAAGFFALTQAGAFATFGESAVSPGERGWILVAAVTAVAALAFTAIRVQHAERLRPEGGVHIQSVLDWCLRESEERMITAWLILAHRQVAMERVTSNGLRAKQVEAVVWAAGLTLVLCATELILALGVRM